MALLLGLSDLSHAEMFQVIHYRPGAEYQTHYDAYDAASASGQRVMRRGGQRITTALCYLNTPKAGGATGFSEAGFDVKAERGRLLVFNNCSGDGVGRDEGALHAGLPVEEGDKWAFNLWFRQYPLWHNPMDEE